MTRPGDTYIIGLGNDPGNWRASMYSVPDSFDPVDMVADGPGLMSIDSLVWRGVVYERDNLDTTTACNVGLIAPELVTMTSKNPAPPPAVLPQICIVTADGVRFKEIKQ